MVEISKSQLVERTVSGLHDNLVKKLPPLNHNASVLDIGYGTGAWLERLSNAGFSTLHGIDLDITRFQADNATCSQANLDFDDLGLGDREFTMISAIEVIEHLENPGRLFYHVSKHLSKNGYFLLTTPNIHSLQCRLKFFLSGQLASFDCKGDPTHIYPVLMAALHRVLPRYSLQITYRWGYPEKGTLIYRNSINAISTLLMKVLPNDLPGDTLCLLIQKSNI